MAITIRSREGATEVHPAPGENLLYAGLRAGLPLPYECATGTCGTCRARVRSGRVDNAWPSAPGRASLKPELGDILLCQSLAGPPAEPCEVLVPGKLITRPWHRRRPAHGSATLTGLSRLTQDVLSFHLHLDQPMNFLAGQFLSVAFPGVDGYRAFSMTNYQAACTTPAFVIKRVPGGAVSNLLFEQVETGQPELANVTVFGPLGGAVFLPEEGANILAIAGGSGVAGMMAILEQAVTAGYFDERQGRLYFGVRTLSDAFFLEELAALRARAPGLRVVVALSDEAPPAAGTHRGIDVDGGFVHEVAAAHMNGDYDGYTAYVAGPPPMVDRTLRRLVAEGGLPTERIRFDKFA